MSISSGKAFNVSKRQNIEREGISDSNPIRTVYYLERKVYSKEKKNRERERGAKGGTGKAMKDDN